MAWRARRNVPCCDPKLYENYYVNQAGNGLPVFSGARVQRGHGLGNIFSGLVKAAMPLVKSGVKALGKHGLKTGIQIAEDVLSGQKPKRAIQRRTKKAGSQLLDSALHQFIPGPPGEPRRGRQQQKGRKRRAPSQTGSSSRSKRQRDIFG